ncbi:hypothetical protein AGLY_006664 [Aphis glycines]|uniref:Uncharacterized protein n=1 Tax=Aphis glycines TaxID=307491 RepID=A0A6G0TU11_APHGL|nr:hypothetical protein AGLY_006664 [Aphis glycines]
MTPNSTTTTKNDLISSKPHMLHNFQLCDSERSDECIDFTMMYVKSKHFLTVLKKIEKNKKKAGKWVPLCCTLGGGVDLGLGITYEELCIKFSRTLDNLSYVTPRPYKKSLTFKNNFNKANKIFIDLFKKKKNNENYNSFQTGQKVSNTYGLSLQVDLNLYSTKTLTCAMCHKTIIQLGHERSPATVSEGNRITGLKEVVARCHEYQRPTDHNAIATKFHQEIFSCEGAYWQTFGSIRPFQVYNLGAHMYKYRLGVELFD